MAELKITGDPESFLLKVLDVFKSCNLQVILVGNAAAMIHGAPVTTKDADFFFRDAPVNLKKIRKAAAMLGLSLSQPFLPASDVYRLEGGPVDIDLMPHLPGYRYESLRSKAQAINIAGRTVLVPGLDLIIKMKKRANRPKDKAVLPVLENTLSVLSQLPPR